LEAGRTGYHSKHQQAYALGAEWQSLSSFMSLQLLSNCNYGTIK